MKIEQILNEHLKANGWDKLPDPVRGALLQQITKAADKAAEKGKKRITAAQAKVAEAVEKAAAKGRKRVAAAQAKVDAKAEQAARKAVGRVNVTSLKRAITEAFPPSVSEAPKAQKEGSKGSDSLPETAAKLNVSAADTRAIPSPCVSGIQDSKGGVR